MRVGSHFGFKGLQNMWETKASDAALDETEQESEVEGSAWVCAYLCNYICVDFICLL